MVGFLLLFCGLATKVGWAPVHNWLPDAHSEAPPPISALLSAALLPAVMLVAWRAQRALAPAIGLDVGRNMFIAFGLISLAVAVPFLWRPMAWKRLLAYSSLEHMGVIALGIGFGNPVAIAGVVLHLAGHAVAKSLGFYAATPLFDLRPSARLYPARGLVRENPALAAGMGLSLGSLSGLPPSPLFFSEVLILVGGFTSGHAVSAAVAALLLALGFLGLAHVLVQDLLGSGRRPRRERTGGRSGRHHPDRSWRPVCWWRLPRLTVVLPGSEFVHDLGWSDAVKLELVPLGDWHARCEAALADGGRFLALYAADRGVGGGDRAAGRRGRGVRALFSGPDGHQLLAAETPDARGAHHRRSGARGRLGRARGPRPVRTAISPVTLRCGRLSRIPPSSPIGWCRPPGHDVHQVAVGPIHAGIIESGHFRFHVVGEKVLHLDLRLFYKHRGLERAAEGRTLEEGLAYAQRACAACAVSNSVAYAHAAESLLGLWPEPELARARTVLLELERLYNHLNDIGAVCAGVGFAAGSMAFAALKERVQRLNRSLTGHRFLFDTIAVGGSTWQVGRDAAAEARRELVDLAVDGQKGLARSALQRPGPGSARRRRDHRRRGGAALGGRGPGGSGGGRCRGCARRQPPPRLPGIHPGGASFGVGRRRQPGQRARPGGGDLAAHTGRVARRRRWSPPAPTPGRRTPSGWRAWRARAVRRSAFWKPRTAASRGSTCARPRSPTGPPWPRAAAGAILTDFPVINKSFELCYSCCDR